MLFVVLSTLQAVQCRNHVRALFRRNDSLYVCSTGSYSPQEFDLNVCTIPIFISISSSLSVGILLHVCASASRVCALASYHRWQTDFISTRRFRRLDIQFEFCIRRAPSTPATVSKQHCRMLQVERFFRQFRMLLRHCCRFRQQCRTKFRHFDKVETNWTCSIVQLFRRMLLRQCCLLLRQCCWCGRGLSEQRE